MADSLPMASAPFIYDDAGRVDWGTMWTSFCDLALNGGPPHRGFFLAASPLAVVDSVAWQRVAAEIARGVTATTGCVPAVAAATEPGWLAFAIDSPVLASWLAVAIIAEGVDARAMGAALWLPVAESYGIGEIKNVITAMAKTHHSARQHAGIGAAAVPTDATKTLLRAALGGVLTADRSTR